MAGPWDSYADPNAPAAPVPAATTYRAPDGSVVTLPAGQDPQASMEQHQQVGGGGSYTPIATTDSTPWNAYKDITDPTTLRPDFMTGFTNDFLKPGANVLNWLGNVPGVNAGLDALSKVANRGEGLGEAIQDYKNYLPQQAAKGMAPSALGSIAGSVAGTLPVAAVGGGAASPFIQGGIGGALLGDGSLKGTVGGALGGSVIGGLGGVFGDTLINSIAPTLKPGVQAILKETPNFPFTMGSLAKGPNIPSAIEAVGKLTPFGGEMIRARGNDALEAGVRGAAGIANAPGAAAPTGETGFDLMRAVKSGYDQGYDKVRTAGPVALDDQYAAEMGSARQGAQPISQGGNLPDDLAQRFSNVINREVVNRVDPVIGGFTAEGAMDAKSALNKEIGKLTSPGALGGNKPGPSLFEGDYVDALQKARDAVRGAMGRSDPAAGLQMAAMDRAYPAKLAFENAVVNSTKNGTTPDGFFTPQQLTAATRSMGTKSQVATNFAPAVDGPTPLQRLAAYGDALKRTLPRGYKEVSSPMSAALEGGVGAGVIGSDILGGHGAGAGVAGIGGLLAGLYTRPAQAGIVNTLLGNAAKRAALERVLGVPLSTVTTAPAAAALGGQGGANIGPAFLGPLFPQATAATQPAY